MPGTGLAPGTNFQPPAWRNENPSQDEVRSRNPLKYPLTKQGQSALVVGRHQMLVKTLGFENCKGVPSCRVSRAIACMGGDFPPKVICVGGGVLPVSPCVLQRETKPPVVLPWLPPCGWGGMEISRCGYGLYCEILKCQRNFRPWAVLGGRAEIKSRFNFGQICVLFRFRPLSRSGAGPARSG